jgi:hypothetical protein
MGFQGISLRRGGMDQAEKDMYTMAMLTFLDEHPEWRASVRWETVPGEREPQPIGPPKALIAFIWWAYERGMITKPEKIPGQLEELRAMERDQPPDHSPS